MDGPDGQVWVIDWYNFIVQHNPTPAGFEIVPRGAYVTPLRDKTHGRIWRVVHASAHSTARRCLTDGSAISRISDALQATIDDPQASDADRVSAAEGLVRLPCADATTVDCVTRRVGGQVSPAMSAGLIAALGRSPAAEAPAAILDRLGLFTPPVREAALRTVLANRDWVAALVDRFEKRQVYLGDIPIRERTKLTEHPDRTIGDRAKGVLAAGRGLASDWCSPTGGPSSFRACPSRSSIRKATVCPTSSCSAGPTASSF